MSCIKEYPKERENTESYRLNLFFFSDVDCIFVAGTKKPRDHIFGCSKDKYIENEETTTIFIRYFCDKDKYS